MRRLSFATISCFILVLSGANSHAATLTIPTTIAVTGMDVFSGPTFTVPAVFTASDVFTVQATGEVNLAVGGMYWTNPAGVITRPDTTNSGNHPGEVSLGTNQTVAPGLPYGALLIGNSVLGFHAVFPANAATGLGGSTPPTTLSIARSLGDIFGAGSAITQGTTLEFRVNDLNSNDNGGQFRLSPGATAVPEPATIALLLTGIAGFQLRKRI